MERISRPRSRQRANNTLRLRPVFTDDAALVNRHDNDNISIIQSFNREFLSNKMNKYDHKNMAEERCSFLRAKPCIHPWISMMWTSISCFDTFDTSQPSWTGGMQNDIVWLSSPAPKEQEKSKIISNKDMHTLHIAASNKIVIPCAYFSCIVHLLHGFLGLKLVTNSPTFVFALERNVSYVLCFAYLSRLL